MILRRPKLSGPKIAQCRFSRAVVARRWCYDTCGPDHSSWAPAASVGHDKADKGYLSVHGRDVGAT